MGHSYNGSERRQHLRFPKTFNLYYSIKGLPEKKADETSIRDISKGGVRFTTSYSLKEGSILEFELAIPYIAPRKLKLEGIVISSKEINPGLVYEIRAKFDWLDNEALKIIDEIEKQNKKDK